MTIIQAVFLGLLQGLTEFLPISSSGHLVLGQKLLGFSKPPVIFDIVVHVGTLSAVLIFFRQILWHLTKETIISLFKGQFKEIPSIVWFIAIGTVPAVVVGLVLDKYLVTIFNSVTLVGITLIVTAGLLFSTNLINQTEKNKKELSNISWLDALIIGLLQALAILPGISRSGSTVVAGLWRNLKRETAFVFSFLLSVPAILGALGLEIRNLTGLAQGEILLNLIGFTTAAISGYLALFLFKKTVIQGKLTFFGVYCLIIGTVTLIFNFNGGL